MGDDLQRFLENLPVGRAIADKAKQVYETALSQSRYMNDGNFDKFHPDDLRSLFDQYEAEYFQGRIRPALRNARLRFRISSRMTSSGGTTTWLRSRNNQDSYEITVSSALLFRTFTQDDHRPISVSGIQCRDRLEALQRVMEHEMVHLAEMLVWRDSNCRGERFQTIARRLFDHRERTHQLITPREQALARYGVRPGSRVRFRIDGKQFRGIVNRITKRATVLVPCPQGRPFSDGQTYRVFYIPLPMLEVETTEP